MPTLKEVGIEDLEITQWYALFAPAKTPPSVVRRLNGALNDVLKDPSTVARMEDDGARVEVSTPGQLHDLLMSESERWAAVVRQAGLRQELSLE